MRPTPAFTARTQPRKSRQHCAASRGIGGSSALFGAIAAACVLCGCDPWRPPPSSPDELGAGLVVMYPGSLNTYTELSGFYYAFRDAGITQAIQVVPWAQPLDHMIDPSGAQVRIRQRAADEAQRITQYQDEHPGAPVTLLGYSGGAWMTILTAEALPPGRQVDRVILMSPAVSQHYDLAAMLDHTSLGAVVFSSDKDQFTVDVVTSLNAADGTHGPPAATFSFDTVSDKLIEVPYDPAWAALENWGGHADYLFKPVWVTTFVTPWIATAAPG